MNKHWKSPDLVELNLEQTQCHNYTNYCNPPIDYNNSSGHESCGNASFQVSGNYQQGLSSIFDAIRDWFSSFR